MPYDPAVGVRFLAFDVTLRAKCGTLTQNDVDDLRGKAEEALASDNPLFRAITAFATHFPLVRDDPEGLSDQAQTLLYAVDDANRASAEDERAVPELDAWADRKDING
ncbi:MAG: hypothetical protein AAF891_00215 [Pseudomonadota bacterium]